MKIFQLHDLLPTHSNRQKSLIPILPLYREGDPLSLGAPLMHGQHKSANLRFIGCQNIQMSLYLRRMLRFCAEVLHHVGRVSNVSPFFTWLRMAPLLRFPMNAKMYVFCPCARETSLCQYNRYGANRAATSMNTNSRDLFSFIGFLLLKMYEHSKRRKTKN